MIDLKAFLCLAKKGRVANLSFIENQIIPPSSDFSLSPFAPMIREDQTAEVH